MNSNLERIVNCSYGELRLPPAAPAVEASVLRKSRTKYKKWSDEEKDRLLSMWRSGMSGNDMAAALGRSYKSTVGELDLLRGCHRLASSPTP